MMCSSMFSVFIHRQHDLTVLVCACSHADILTGESSSTLKSRIVEEATKMANAVCTAHLRSSLVLFFEWESILTN